MYGALTTLENVKGWLKQTSPADDGHLSFLIESLSDSVGRMLGRDNLGSVESYVEVYPGTGTRIVLDHYPVVVLSSVTLATRAQPLLTDPTMIGTASGIFLDRDRRTLRVSSDLVAKNGNTVVVYTAGYATKDIPAGLEQAMNQWIGEIYKSKEWIGYTSKSLAGETVTFDKGTNFGMSPRTAAMFNPYKNRIPAMGSGA